MAIGRQPSARQEALFVATSEINTSVHLGDPEARIAKRLLDAMLLAAPK